MKMELQFNCILDRITAFDIFVYEYVLTHRSEMGIKIFSLITHCGDPLTLSIFFGLILLVLLWKKKPNQIYIMAVIFLFSWSAMQFLKSFFQRNRPAGADTLLKVIGFSFPSGHAMVSTSFYGLILFNISNRINIKYRLFVYLIGGGFIILIGVSRVYLGVHYLSDVIGGFILGSLILVVGIKILKRVN